MWASDATGKANPVQLARCYTAPRRPTGRPVIDEQLTAGGGGFDYAAWIKLNCVAFRSNMMHDPLAAMMIGAQCLRESLA
jgi:hypothetical protein